ncbi:MAG: formyltransferase family protein, partial [Candidatus Marinimicrobia bacterium]|nr:formyltransferase family protein [Candidatus Neomarinimicrobiota bacterium]
MANKIKIGVIGSTNGTDLQAILDAIASGELEAEVSVVLSNRKNAYILERAENHNVPAVFISHKGKSREEFDAKMTAILNKHGVGL